MPTPNATPVVPVPAAAAPAAAAPVAPADDFDSVFAEITKLNADGKEPDDTKAPVVDAAKPDGAAPVAVADPDPAVPVEPAAVPAEPAVAAVEPAAVVVDPPVVSPELIAAQEKIAALEAANEAKKPPVAEVDDPAPEVVPEPTPIKWYEHSAEETAELATFDKEWPDQSAAVALRTKAAVYNAVQYMFAEISKAYGPKMTRFEEMSDAIADQLQLAAIRGAHSDYETIYPNVVEWVDTLPTAFKNGAKEIMKSGTPEEVSELVGAYKKANPAATPAVVAAPAVSKTELSAAAKKAASKLTVVDSKRTAPVAAADPNDFDGAWAEASAVK